MLDVSAQAERSTTYRADMADHIVTRQTAARVILDHPGFGVSLQGDPTDSIEALRSRMARFSDGAVHERRRRNVDRVLHGLDAAQLRVRVFDLAAARLRPGCDLLPHARTIPLEAVAGLWGFEDPPGVAAGLLQLVDRLAPRTDDPVRPSADEVQSVLDQWFVDPTDEDVARISVFFQTADATAALIVAAAETLLPWRSGGEPAIDDVAAVATSRETVTSTTRRAQATITIDERAIGAGETVIVRLDPDLAFGSGRHRCPGREHALAAATGFVVALHHAGLWAAPSSRLQPRPNISLPQRVICRPDSETKENMIGEDQHR